MRLWSLHPKWLDGKGLVALWREGLLARRVLRGKTRGYRLHPQLARFRSAPRPLAAVESYLHGVLQESQRRGYRFDPSKLTSRRPTPKIGVTRGQLEHEWTHLLNKLKVRDFNKYLELRKTSPSAHPLFRVGAGQVAPWEKIHTTRRARPPRG